MAGVIREWNESLLVSIFFCFSLTRIFFVTAMAFTRAAHVFSCVGNNLKTTTFDLYSRIEREEGEALVRPISARIVSGHEIRIAFENDFLLFWFCFPFPELHTSSKNKKVPIEGKRKHKRQSDRVAVVWKRLFNGYINYGNRVLWRKKTGWTVAATGSWRQTMFSKVCTSRIGSGGGMRVEKFSFKIEAM